MGKLSSPTADEQYNAMTNSMMKSKAVSSAPSSVTNHHEVNLNKQAKPLGAPGGRKSFQPGKGRVYNP